MTTLPNSSAEMAALVRDILPAFADIDVGPEGDIKITANSDNRGLLLYLGGSDPADRGWAYRFGQDSGRVTDGEDLGWSLCDVLGVRRPTRASLQALADEASTPVPHESPAGLAWIEAMTSQCRAAMEGDAAAIVACARMLAEAANRS